MASHKTNFLCDLFVILNLCTPYQLPQRGDLRGWCVDFANSAFLSSCISQVGREFFSSKWKSPVIGIIARVEDETSGSDRKIKYTLKCALLNIHQSAPNHFKSFSIYAIQWKNILFVITRKKRQFFRNNHWIKLLELLLRIFKRLCKRRRWRVESNVPLV